MTKPRSETAEETELREREGEAARCLTKFEDLLAEQTDVEARVRAHHEAHRPSAALAERERLAELATEIDVAAAHLSEAMIELLTARLPALERAAGETAEAAFAYRHGEAERVRLEQVRLDNEYQGARQSLADVRQRLAEVRRKAGAYARMA